MTTFEHAALGINGVLACGLHRRWGWKIVAVGGVAAIAPDWDGLPMFIDMARFEHGHRVWGHNVFACLLLALALGALDYRFDWFGRIARWLVQFGPMRDVREHVGELRATFSSSGLMIWILVAFVAALSQIPADAVVSGGKGLSDWALKPLWPVSNLEVIYPMVPWGNVGVTVIFAIAMIAQAKKPSRSQTIAIVSLVSMCLYIFIWGAWIGRAA